MQAEEVLLHYWDGTLPVNPIQIAKTAGVDVKTKDFADTTWIESGLVNGKKTIFVSNVLAKEGGKRLRFAVAHALGHCMLHKLEEIKE